MSFLKFWSNNNNNLTTSAKVIEKLKHGIHGLETGTECKEDDTDYKEEEEEIEEEPLDFAMDYLTPLMLEEARIELNETEENKSRHLEKMRKLIRKEPKLLTPMDDNFLLAFLRCRKHNVKKAFKILQNYWHFRKDNEHIYDTSDQNEVKRLILCNFLGFLTRRDRKGCVVMILKVGLWDPDVYTYDDICRAVTAILIHSIQYEATQIMGYRIIMDARDLSWAQLKMCTPTNILTLVHSTQYCFPARYKGFHVLTNNRLFNVGWALVHPFLPSKVKKRISLHGSDLSPLLEHIHPSVLPVEFGGEAPPFENSSWAEVMDESADQVMEQLNYGYMD